MEGLVGTEGLESRFYRDRLSDFPDLRSGHAEPTELCGLPTGKQKRPPKMEGLVGTEGLEPPTCCL